MLDILNQSQSLLGLGLRRAKDQEIIRETDKPKVGLRQSQVKLMKNDISEEGRNDPTLGRTARNSVEDAILKHASREKLPDKGEDVTISDPLRDQVNNEVVVDIIEASRNIGINHKLETIIPKLNDGFDSLMLVTPRTEAERKVRESWLKDGFKQSLEDSLSDPIPDSGDAQRAELPFPFREVDPAEGLGLITPPLFKVSHQSGKILLKNGLKH